MAGPQRYSRLVAVVKVALPLAAVALLVALFVVARSPATDGVTRVPDDDLSALARDQRATRPIFRGTTEDASPLTVAAESAVPRDRDNSVFDLAQVDARLRAPDGGATTLVARAGTVDRAADLGVFTGAVRVATTDGWVLETQRLDAALTGARAASPGPVRVRGPGVTLDAGAMVVLARDGRPGREAVFTGGVRLLYEPQAAEELP